MGILPHFTSGLSLIKYINNHPEQFDYPKLAWGLGFINTINTIIFEYCNFLVLFTRGAIIWTIGTYIAVGIIINFNKMHLNMLLIDRGSVLNELFDEVNQPWILRKSRNIEWKDRSTFFKFGRFF